jgi:hypothetical protein
VSVFARWCPSLTMAGPKELATSWQATKAEGGNETGSQSRIDGSRKVIAEQAGGTEIFFPFSCQIERKRVRLLLGRVSGVQTGGTLGVRHLPHEGCHESSEPAESWIHAH